MTIKAIFFDIDGTLVDSNDLHVIAWEQGFARFGFSVHRQAIHEQIGKGADNLVPTLLPDESEAVQKQVGDAHGEIFKERFLAQVRPFPHARELMQRVKDAGQKVVLASSASQEELDHYIDLLDAQDLVAASTSVDDVEKSKPAPDIFIGALKKVAPLKPGEVIVIGDTPSDIEAAAKSGIATVAVRSGKFDERLLKQAGAVAIFDDVAAILSGYGSSPLAE